MSIIYTITLKSDAHIGSGVGGEIVNNYVSRDQKGLPVIHASHVKGLLRQTAKDILEPLGISSLILEQTFGAPGWRMGLVHLDDRTASEQSSLFFSAAKFEAENVSPTHPSVRLISRTSIDPQTGSALDNSLRTAEAVAAESRFTGRIELLDSTSPTAQSSDLLLRLSLLSLRAVGASRNRGAGQCVVEIQNEKRTCGQLLKALVEQMNRQVDAPKPIPIPATVPSTKQGVVLLDVRFTAMAPLLCPDGPEVSNVLSSDFSIPASAVQGALLTCVNRLNPQAASACFADARFRAWPMQPCPINQDAKDWPWPVRVSLTHRVPKDVAVDRALGAVDVAVDWQEQVRGAPLKAQDGVLLRSVKGDIALWRSKDMPRIFSTHGVLNDPASTDGRNLYSIEAMAPLYWRGLLALPEEYVDLFKQALSAADGKVAFGKARSVRGMGDLSLTPLPSNRLPFEPACYEQGQPVLITQSPLAIDASDWSSDQNPTAKQILTNLVNRWARDYQLGEAGEVWAATGVRFGWNRLGRSDARSSGRAPALRVILPGAVIRLKDKVDPVRLTAALLAGIGGHRDRGFGCVLPHPGKAKALYRDPFEPDQLESEGYIRDGVKEAMLLINKIDLSASSIASVLSRLERGTDEALEFLKQQAGRGSASWTKWESSHREFLRLLDGPPDVARVALQMLRDLVVSANDRHNDAKQTLETTGGTK